MSKCLKFCTGTHFNSKMSVCRHELGVQPPNLPAIPTLVVVDVVVVCLSVCRRRRRC